MDHTSLQRRQLSYHISHRNEFVEKELAKRRGVGPASGNDAENPSAVSDVLYEIPDHLKVASQPVVEGNVTFSASMLTAIPEVDLGIEYVMGNNGFTICGFTPCFSSAKLKNIEDTEKAKRKMMEERAKRKTGETVGPRGSSLLVISLNSRPVSARI